MERINHLASLIGKHTRFDGLQETAISGLRLSRYSTSRTPRRSIDRAVLCFVAQGAKSVLSAQQRWRYDWREFLIIAMDLPLVAQIEDATRERPFLGINLDLDLTEVGEVSEMITVSPCAAADSGQENIFLHQMEDSLLEALIRLVELLERPHEAGFMYPLLRREIVYRVLVGNDGALLNAFRGGNQAIRVGQGIRWLRTNLNKSMRSRELAEAMSMSLTSMHAAFKAATGMSPVQFRQHLRLQEARRILLYEGENAETASRRVGYDSPSQFNREYRRMFGAPPRQDVARIRLAEPANLAEIGGRAGTRTPDLLRVKHAR